MWQVIDVYSLWMCQHVAIKTLAIEQAVNLEPNTVHVYKKTSVVCSLPPVVTPAHAPTCTEEV